MHRRTIRLVAALAALAAIVPARAGAASPDDTPAGASADPAADAERLFARGSELFRAGRWVEALDTLRASHRLVPSPNSGLLIARCLRALGRRPEAAATYADVEAEARRRSADDPAYAQTADAAASEGAATRASLGSITVHLAHPRPTTRVEIDGSVAAIGGDRDVLAWHDPGTASVRVVSPSGSEETRTVLVRAGGDARLDVDGDLPRAAGPAPSPSAASPPVTREPAPAADASPAWTLPAAGIAGGLAAVGVVVFAGFGSSSHSTYEDLLRTCGPHACGDAERSEADTGMRNQRIANVGLALGVVGAVAAAALLVVHVTSTTHAHAAGAAP